MYYNEYIAYTEMEDAVKSLDLKLNASYADSAFLIAMVVGFIGMALLLFNAIVVKRGRVFGIIVACLQPVAMFGAHSALISYANVDFSKLLVSATSKISMQDAMNKVQEKLAQNISEYILPELFGFIFWSILLLGIAVMTFVYFILLFKVKKLKIMPILALVLGIIRVLTLSVDMVGMFTANATQAGQETWDIVYAVIILLPMVLVAIQGLVHLLTKNNPVAQPAVAYAAPAAAPVAPAAAPVAEAPVAAPAAEAPVAEKAPATETTENN